MKLTTYEKELIALIRSLQAGNEATTVVLNVHDGQPRDVFIQYPYYKQPYTNEISGNDLINSERELLEEIVLMGHGEMSFQVYKGTPYLRDKYGYSLLRGVKQFRLGLSEWQRNKKTKNG